MLAFLTFRPKGALVLLLVISLFALLICSYVTVCWIAIWVGVGRRHWFLRGAILVAVFALLTGMRAFQPMVWSMIWLPLLAWAAKLLASQVHMGSLVPSEEAGDETVQISHGTPFQFRLQDSLLAAVLFGGAFALLAFALRQGVTWEWRQMVLFGICPMIAVACWALALRFRAPQGRIRSLVLLLLLVISLIPVASWTVPRLMATSVQFMGAQFNTAVTLVFVSSYVLFLLFTLHLFALWHFPRKESQRGGLFRAFSTLWAIVIFAPTVVLTLAMLRPYPIPASPYKEDGHSVRLWQLVEELVALNPQELTTANLERATAHRTQNENSPLELYAELTKILEEPRQRDRVLQNHLTPDHFHAVVDQAQLTRSLGRQLINEAQAHFGMNQFEQGAIPSVTVIRLGNSSARGGTVIDTLVGVAVEGIAVGAIAPQINRFPIDLTTQMIRWLEEVDEAREPLELLMRREAAYSDRTINWLYRFQRIVANWAGQEMGGNSAVKSAILRRDMMLRLMIVELAVHAYQTKYGDSPQTLDNLTPEFLRQVPEDPYSGEPLRYRISDKGPLVYSVGQDGVDDSGSLANPTNYMQTGKDYDLRMFRRAPQAATP